MSFNGSGLFQVNVAGNPVVTGTVISSTWLNASFSDFATGLSTCILKDGTQTLTANIPFGGFKATGLAVATTTGDALSYGRAANVTTLTVTTVNASGVVTGGSFVGLATAGPATATAVGYMGAPLNTQNGNYTLVLGDQGNMLYHTSGSAHAYTIPPNASVALPIGTVVLIENEVAAGVVTVTRGAGVSMFLRGTSVTDADRALAANGSCAIKKVATNTWSITGIGLT